ncbi:recombinase family protein [bacterium]|nr:recombinase family protein [bacterium]
MIYAYFRVSTDKQDYTCQKFGVLEFAKNKGWNIDKEIIDDGISGTILAKNRKLRQILKYSKKGDIVITSELSRFGRNTKDIINTCDLLTEKGVECWFVKQNMGLDNSPMGKMLIGIFACFSQLERDLIAQRTKEALAKRKVEGMVLGRPKGRKSSHYKWTGKEEKIKALLNKNLTKKEITKKLKISFPTLKKFIDNYL